MVSRPYMNKQERLILGKEEKNLIKKKKKMRRFRCVSYSIGKSCTECFWLRKKRTKKNKKTNKQKWQEETELLW